MRVEDCLCGHKAFVSQYGGSRGRARWYTVECESPHCSSNVTSASEKEAVRLWNIKNSSLDERERVRLMISGVKA